MKLANGIACPSDADRTPRKWRSSPSLQIHLRPRPTSMSPLAIVSSVKRAVTFVAVLLLGANVLAPLCAQEGRTNAKQILILISEDPDNYKAHETMPVFAKTLKNTNRYD